MLTFCARRFFFFSGCVITFFSLSGIAHGAEDKLIRIALLPFKHSRNISIEEAKYLTERVRTQLMRTGLFEVVSNDLIEAKTRDGSCYTEKCMIELGKALDCEKMMLGSAEAAFGEYTINIKLLDVMKKKYESVFEKKLEKKEDLPKTIEFLINSLTKDYLEDGKRYKTKSNYRPDPYAAGCLSALLGLGIGTYYAGDSTYGTYFLVFDVLSIGSISGGFYMLDSFEYDGGMVLVTAGYVGFFISRYIQVIYSAVATQHYEENLAYARPPEENLMIAVNLDKQKTGLSVSYRF